MLIAQITDLHVSAGTDPTRPDPLPALRRVVELLNTMRPRPDCVIATGDLVEHGTDAEYRKVAATSAIHIPTTKMFAGD